MATLSIRDELARLQTLKRNLEASLQRTEADYRLSEKAKSEQRAAFADALRDAVGYAAQAIFGKVGPQGLEGGAFWERHDALRAKVREARTAADTLDTGRLMNTYQRVPSIVAGASNVGELQAWYVDQADAYERRALQDVGAEAVAGRWPKDAAVGGLLATLKRDRKASLATPDVQAAEASLHALEMDAADAHAELSQMVGGVGPLSLDPAARTLRAVRVRASFEDASDPHAPMRVTVEKVDAGGAYWPEGGDA